MLKPLSDAIGTAAGVAWPTFGILSAVLALSMGSGIALVFGSVSIGLFIFVALPMVYWSYKNIQEQNQRNAEALARAKLENEEFIIKFFSLYLRKYIFKNGITDYEKLGKEVVANYILEKLSKNNNTLALSTRQKSVILNFINKLAGLPNDVRQEVLLQNIEVKIDEHRADLRALKMENSFQTKPTLSKPLVIKTAAINFFAAFGAIAGGTAGASGVLVGLGIITSLASVPIVGWLGLAGAITFGMMLASVQIYNLYEDHKKENAINHYVQNNNRLKEKFDIKNAKLAVRLKDQAVFSSQHFKLSHSSLFKAQTENSSKLSASSPTSPGPSENFSSEVSAEEGLESPVESRLLIS